MSSRMRIEGYMKDLSREIIDLKRELESADAIVIGAELDCPRPLDLIIPGIVS